MRDYAMKAVVTTMILLFALPLVADKAKACIQVLDSETSRPIEGATVKAWFEVDIGWRAWSETTPIRTQTAMTDAQGRCVISDETNTGSVSFEAKKPGCYYQSGSWHKYDHKNVIGVWQPDDLVVTLCLQRVEHPLPLFVKRVELHNCDDGIFGKNGPDGILQFDMLKGDWLPPHGDGACADLTIESTKTITGQDRDFNFQRKKWEGVSFYDFQQKISMPSNDCLKVVNVDTSSGIKIRKGGDSGLGEGLFCGMGLRKRIDKRKRWHYDRYKDYDKDRCYTFRIRSRYDEKGKLVEAYYGKIYGDIEFDYKEDLGLTRVRFLYYLNTNSLDDNLEWDMTTNLCAEPGNVGRIP